jgi:hypothetical protein
MRAPEIGYGYGTVSMMNNWWGTTDTSAIEGLIYDGNDLGTLQRIDYSVEDYEIGTAGIERSSLVSSPSTVSLIGLGFLLLTGVVQRKTIASSSPVSL